MHVVADDVGATGENALNLRHVDLLLSEVMTTDWFQTMTASHIEGTGLIDYAALERVATVPVSYAGDGRIRVETTATLFGAKVVAQITDQFLGWSVLNKPSRSAIPRSRLCVDLPDFTGDGATANSGETHPAERPGC